MIKSPTRNSSSGPEAGQSAGSVADVRPTLPRFGVVLFDESRSSGWASLSGQAPFRFRKPEDLPNDCIWVSSANSTDFWEHWKKMHHMRPAEFMSKLSFLAADFGLPIEGPGKFGSLAKQACEVLAPTIHRAMVIAAQVYGWKNPVQMLRSDTLAEDLRRYFDGLVRPPAVPPQMRGPLSSAQQTYSSPVVMAKYDPGRVRVTLRFNRLTHAQAVMSTPMPDGNWSFESSELAQDFSMTLEQALDPERPCMVNATVEFAGHDQDIASICAFGSQPGSAKILRNWISQPELRWLSKQAHVQITGAMFSSATRPLPPQLQLPEMLRADPFFEMSVSAGMVAEAHWKALARDIKSKPGAGKEKEITVWAVWLRAVDRALCFELALAAYQAGFIVTGYGGGGVQVECDRAELPQLLDFTITHGVAHPAFRPIFKEHGLVNE